MGYIAMAMQVLGLADASLPILDRLGKATVNVLALLASRPKKTSGLKSLRGRFHRTGKFAAVAAQRTTDMQKARWLCVLILIGAWGGMAHAQVNAKTRPTQVGQFVQDADIYQHLVSTPKVCESGIAGTLGINFTDGLFNYASSAAHVLAVTQDGLFDNASVGELEPDVTDALADGTLPACNSSTPQQAVETLSIGELFASTPFNFSGFILNTDFALLRGDPGVLGTAVVNNAIPAYSSNIPAYPGLVPKGTPLIMFGAAGGFRTGKALGQMLRPQRYRICTYPPHDLTAAQTTCGRKVAHVGNLQKISMCGPLGDSGSTVFTATSCPMPVGVLVGCNSDKTAGFMLPFAIALNKINMPSLTVVPQGSCSTSSADLAAISSFSPSINTALTNRSNLQTWIQNQSVPYVIDVALDNDQPTTYYDVVCDNGYTQFGSYTITDASYVQIYLQQHGLYDVYSPTGLSYNGVPVETSTIDVADLSATTGQ